MARNRSAAAATPCGADWFVMLPDRAPAARVAGRLGIGRAHV
mgnify:CR=1 FL=1